MNWLSSKKPCPVFVIELINFCKTIKNEMQSNYHMIIISNARAISAYKSNWMAHVSAVANDLSLYCWLN